MALKYNYEKEVNSDKLEKAVKSNANLLPIFDGISTVGNNVTISFVSDAESFKSELDAIVANHDTNDIEATIANAISKAQKAGEAIILEFGTRNVLLSLTTTETKSMLLSLSPLIAALRSGSLKIALDIIDNDITTDALITNELVSEYRAKIQYALDNL